MRILFIQSWLQKGSYRLRVVSQDITVNSWLFFRGVAFLWLIFTIRDDSDYLVKLSTSQPSNVFTHSMYCKMLGKILHLDRCLACFCVNPLIDARYFFDFFYAKCNNQMVWIYICLMSYYDDYYLNVSEVPLRYTKCWKPQNLLIVPVSNDLWDRVWEGEIDKCSSRDS